MVTEPSPRTLRDYQHEVLATIENVQNMLGIVPLVFKHLRVPLAKPKKTAKQLRRVLPTALSGQEALKLLKEREQKKQDKEIAKQN
ncbi:hypothetical protein DPMN_076586 [Dreissena polymorpha]|uniref:Uncharacterized protein n=1 Tax=Dreissena polymorpha TaxID=45954 RepID=A0A9D4BQN0_DREPO|nr:hypothetical protein DPMN_076586 [Dreissena polymorpha]